MLTAKMLELGRSPESWPVSQDSGQMCGRRMIELRQVLCLAALVASIHNNDLNFFGNRIDPPLAPVPRRNLLAQVALTLTKPEDILCEGFIIGSPFGAQGFKVLSPSKQVLTWLAAVSAIGVRKAT